MLKKTYHHPLKKTDAEVSSCYLISFVWESIPTAHSCVISSGHLAISPHCPPTITVCAILCTIIPRSCVRKVDTKLTDGHYTSQGHCKLKMFHEKKKLLSEQLMIGCNRM